jgi:hypothetical protein
MPLNCGADPLVRAGRPRPAPDRKRQAKPDQGVGPRTRGSAPLCGLIFVCCLQAAAQPPAEATPKDVLTLIRETAEDLSNKDTGAFLNHFDPKMPGYETLHYEVEGLAARDAIVSTIEIVTDKGDNQRRMMELDWIIIVESEPAQRKIVKVTIERQGKRWKITALDPVEFFKPAAAP